MSEKARARARPSSVSEDILGDVPEDTSPEFKSKEERLRNSLEFQPDGTCIIRLSHPVERSDGSPLDLLHMRRVKVKDRLLAQRQAKKGSNRSQEEIAAAAEITLVANLAEVTTADIESLDGYDYERVSVALQDFLSSPGTESGAP